MSPRLSFNPIPFLVWIALNPEARKREEQCDLCDGEGTCTCSRCDGEHECGRCDGNGVFNSAEDLYHAQLKADNERWKRSNREGRLFA